MNKPNDRFIFMKVGQHAGEDFATILQRKRQEYESTGMVFWGYGGSICHPVKQVQPFARATVATQGEIYLLMHSVRSTADPDILPAQEYSTDGISWQPIPKGIEVLGSRYAFVLDEITEESLNIILDDFKVGIGPSRGKVARDYLKGRVDKACMERVTSISSPVPGVEFKPVEYSARLKDPYAVLLR